VRAEATVLVVGVVVAGCGLAARLTRPEGDGGWSAVRRSEELATRAAAAGVSAAPAPGATLTLADALALASGGNRRIAEAGRAVAATAARVRQARARLLPATTASGRYTWYTDPLTNQVEFPPGLFPAGVRPPVVTIREAEAGTVNGTLVAPLDLTGELLQALGAAQAGYRGERARLWATTLGEQVAVVRAYFGLLQAERLREVTVETLDADRRQLRTASDRFRAGRLTKNELLVVQVAARNAEQELVQRDLAIADARWSLNEAVGLPVDAPTAVADVAGRPVAPALEDALREAYARNPVIVALLEEQQRLEATASSLARGRLPRVQAGAAADWTTSDVVQPQGVGQGFVGFSWDLGTDGRREAEIAEARVQAERNRLAVERELRRLEAAVRLAHQAVAERLSALEAAAAGVGQAEENLRIREQQFAAGRAQSDDVLEAEALLAAQRATLATALYQAHVRRAELRQLMGLPVDGD
jgi:outer membrane protein